MATKQKTTLSIFTITHNPVLLFDAYQSLKDQDFFEWVILYNNGAVPIGLARRDPRIREVISQIPSDAANHDWIGSLKLEACRLCVGDILLELDHDDMLMPATVTKVLDAFDAYPDVGFVYSNAIHVNSDLTDAGFIFGNSNNWVYRVVPFHAGFATEVVTPEATPSSVSRIWFAPDHLRSFRRSVYDAVGGHNPGMRVLDDGDLMIRMFSVTEFHHIDEPLYVYRHGANTHKQEDKFNEIQQGTMRLYESNIDSLVLMWAKRNGLRAVELGARLNARVGYETVDIVGPADLISDLNNHWPFADNSVGVVLALDIFEHLNDPVHTWQELYRVLAPGGYALIRVPSTDGRGAFQDPTHKSWWNQNSFLYVTDAKHNSFVVGLAGIRFQTTLLYTTAHDSIGVCWTIAHLIKLGDTTVPPGPTQI